MTPPEEVAVTGAMAKNGESYWLVERWVDGQPHWISWHGRHTGNMWVPDALKADLYHSEETASVDAAWWARMDGVPTTATEHVNVAPRASERAP